MRNPLSRALFFVLSLVLLSLRLAPQGHAETFVGSNVDSQIVVALQFNEDAIQSLLPDGWMPTSYAGGPLAGANSLLVFVDRHLARDAEGKPADPSTLRLVALASLARQEDSDEVRTYITRLFVTLEGYDPYANAVTAQISRSASIESGGAAPSKWAEAWTLRPASGGDLSFSLNYQGGVPLWSPGELVPYSNTKPDFHRIYRYDRLVDLAMSEPLGKPLAGDMSLNSTLTELSDLFDGSEKIVAVVMVPFYSREIYLP